MKKKSKFCLYALFLMGFVLILINSCKKNDNNPSNTVSDIDGNVYNMVTIGTQVWMVGNLKVTHYRNGDPLTYETDDEKWCWQTSGTYCYYNNNNGNKDKFGLLYNWFAINDSRNICPTGWHVPTDGDWQTLVNYLGGSKVAGSKMKETGTTLWTSPNADATNESGFTGLPGGYRYVRGTYEDFGDHGYWWSATEYRELTAWCYYLYYNNSIVYRAGYNEMGGLSIRCIRDE